MNEFSDDELFDFVLGHPVARAAEIQRQAATDEEFAATLALMRAMAGAPAPRPTVLPARRWWKVWPACIRHVTAAAIALIMLGGVSWAAWYVLRTPPLLEDNFNDSWLNSDIWRAPRPIVREENGYLALLNRGYLLTDKEFTGPLDLRFRWRWRDLAGWPTYSDALTVMLRTTGQPEPGRRAEALDGISVRFDVADGAILIRRMPLTNEPMLGRTPTASTPLPANAWHDIRITDDGEHIAVYLSGPAITPRKKDVPILEAYCPDPPTGHRIAIYNRERLADVPHESHVDDVLLQVLRP